MGVENEQNNIHNMYETIFMGLKKILISDVHENVRENFFPLFSINYFCISQKLVTKNSEKFCYPFRENMQ